jgi:VanZ family protein
MPSASSTAATTAATATPPATTSTRADGRTARTGAAALMTDVAQGASWRNAWRLLTVVTLVSVSWLAFTPNPPPAADLGWDKANHFTAFGTLAFLGMQCLRPRAGRAWWVLAAALAFGVLIELVQSQIPGRDADAQDVVADMMGAVMGLAIHALALWGVSRIVGVRSDEASAADKASG